MIHMRKRIALLAALALSANLCASVAHADQKIKTKSNIKNDRLATPEPSPPTGEALAKDKAKGGCSNGTHFPTAVLTARGKNDKHPDLMCDADLAEATITTCATGSGDWSGESGEVRTMVAPGYTRLNLCNALQKASVAINASPALLTAMAAAVDSNDTATVRQLLIDNGVPSEMLLSRDGKANPAEIVLTKSNSASARMYLNAMITPAMTVSVDWDLKANVKVLI